MFMRKLCYIFVCICFLVYGRLFAQKVEYAVSDKTIKRFYSKVIGQNEQGIFIIKSYTPFNDQFDQLRFRDNRVELTLMDYKLSAQWSLPLILPEDSEIQNIFFVRKRLFLAYVLYNKELLRKDLYLQEISLKDGSFVAEPLKLDELQFEKKKSRGEFLIGTNKAQSLFFTFHKVNEGPEEQALLSVKVFDSTLTKVWERRFNREDAFPGIKNVQLDNEGNIYLLDLPYESASAKQKAGLNIFKISSQFSEMRKFPVQFDKLGITDAQMVPDHLNRKIIVAGFYSDQDASSAEGIIYAAIDMDADTLLFKTSQSLKAGAREGMSRGGELINYYINQLILRNDGGVVVVAESNFVTESSNYNTYYQQYTTSYTYHYDNVMVLSVNPDGKIDWDGIIRKNQTSENDDAVYSSFITSVYQDKIHMIYNKMIRRRSDIIRYTISNTGTSSEKVLLNSSEEVLIMPEGGKQVSENELIIPCIKKNKPNFIKVTF